MGVFLSRVLVISSPKIIEFSVITAGIVFLLFIWGFWQKLPQAQDFHPDGFVQCPPEAYNVTDDTGRVSCLSCPNCSHGQELLPPCGSSILASDARIKCRGCPQGLFSDRFGISVCKPCGDCGLKTVISSCTDEKDIQCGHCQEGYYEDIVTGTCKDCSLICCEKKQKPANYSTCLATHQCNTNCTRMQTSEKINLELIFGKEHADKSTSSLNTLATKNIKRGIWKHTNRKLKPMAATVPSMKVFITKALGMDVKKRDTNEKLDTNVGLPVEFNGILDMHIVEDLVDTASVRKPAAVIDHPGRLVSPKFRHKLQPRLAMPSLLAKQNEMNMQTQPADTAVPEYAPATLTVLTTRKSQSIFSTAAAPQNVLCVLFALFIFSVMRGLLCTVYKRVRGYLPLVLAAMCPYTCTSRKNHEKQEPEEKQLLGENPDSDGTERSVIHILETIPDEDLNLSELPPEVEDSLVMLLDVEHQQVTEKNVPHVLGHRCLYKYGWQNIGQEFQVSKEKLRYLELLYKQDNGSPTKKLLELLGSQGKTVSELICVLQRPAVNPPVDCQGRIQEI